MLREGSDSRIAAAAEALKKEGGLPLYVVTCFSDRDKLLHLTQRD